MSKPHDEKSVLAEIYDHIHTLNPNDWKKIDYKALAKAFTGVEDEQNGVAFKIIIKAACQMDSKAEFVEAMMSSEVPTIKLSKQELQLLKGGAFNPNDARMAFSFFGKVVAKIQGPGTGNVIDVFAKVGRYGGKSSEVQKLGRTIANTAGDIGAYPWAQVGETFKLGAQEAAKYIKRIPLR